MKEKKLQNINRKEGTLINRFVKTVYFKISEDLNMLAF